MDWRLLLLLHDSSRQSLLNPIFQITDAFFFGSGDLWPCGNPTTASLGMTVFQQMGNLIAIGRMYGCVKGWKTHPAKKKEPTENSVDPHRFSGDYNNITSKKKSQCKTSANFSSELTSLFS
jgi:hypothetical protein